MALIQKLLQNMSYFTYEFLRNPKASMAGAQQLATCSATLD